MKTYIYTSGDAENKKPPIPLIPVQLSVPNQSKSTKIVNCEAILDTGADATLVPLTFLVKLNLKPAGFYEEIFFGDKKTIGIPYQVDFSFAQYNLSNFQVFGCPVDALGELIIVGRDLLNQYRIEFDGPNLKFTIY